MALSALDERAVEPSPGALANVLGPSEVLWHHLISRMEARRGPLSEEWSFSGAKYGWSLRLMRKKRRILYLIPQNEMFLVGVVLGDRSLTVLRLDDVSPDVLRLIDEAPRYGEGTGFRIPVKSLADCADIEVVVEAKMS